MKSFKTTVALASLLLACGVEEHPTLEARLPDRGGVLVDAAIRIAVSPSGCQEVARFDVFQGERSVHQWERPATEAYVPVPTSLDVSTNALELPRDGKPADVLLKVRLTCASGATAEVQLPSARVVPAQARLMPPGRPPGWRFWPRADATFVACDQEQLVLLSPDGTEQARSSETVPCSWADALTSTDGALVLDDAEELIVMDSSLRVLWRREETAFHVAEGKVVLLDSAEASRSGAVVNELDVRTGTVLRSTPLTDVKGGLLAGPILRDGRIQLVTESAVSFGTGTASQIFVHRIEGGVLTSKEVAGRRWEVPPQAGTLHVGIPPGKALATAEAFALFEARDGQYYLQLRSMADGRVLSEAPVSSPESMFFGGSSEWILAAGDAAWSMSGSVITQVRAGSPKGWSYDTGAPERRTRLLAFHPSSGLVLTSGNNEDSLHDFIVLGRSLEPLLRFEHYRSAFVTYDPNGQVLWRDNGVIRLNPGPAYHPSAVPNETPSP